MFTKVCFWELYSHIMAIGVLRKVGQIKLMQSSWWSDIFIRFSMQTLTLTS